jgi:DNA-binding NarL/FixJ family response regulator
MGWLNNFVNRNLINMRTANNANESVIIRVTIIEDDETIRNGYSYLIGQEPGYNVVSVYATYEDAAKRIVSDQPDVILLDIQLPGINGIEAIPKLKLLLPGVYVIMLTVYEDPELIFKALTQGAEGYLAKYTKPSDILRSIMEVMEGGGPMSANVARLVIQSFKKNTESPLTRRETEILEQISNGKSRSRIAAEMFIDLETVKTHIKNIYFKLNVHSRADAIKTARDQRFI